MARELDELQTEELALAKAAALADSEVARLTSMYEGVLDESSLAARALMARLHPGSTGRAYYYQCADDISRLDSALQAHLEGIVEHIGKYLKCADELPSPWKEFEPFDTHSISELLQLAAAEHARIGDSAQKLVRTTLALELETALVKAASDEIDRAARNSSADLLRRCQALALAPGKTEPDSDQIVREHVEGLVQAALPEDIASLQYPAAKTALSRLNQCHNELAQSQSTLLKQELAALASSLVLPTQTVDAIRNALSVESEMLDGWAKLWSTVSCGLDKDNAELERQRNELQRIAASAGNSQIIHPDDTLALSLRRLLGMSQKVCDVALAPAKPVAELSENTAPASLLGLLALPQFSSNAVDEDGDADMQEQGEWRSEGAFTTWEALLADAKTVRKLDLDAQQAVVGQIYAIKGLEQQM
ncbi:hypothetical protein EV174_005643 [Coemansia sp. RSA 2320]|nr:hypothetical protein EV174_005643 [Coemansia sp. RSA 2320]